MDFENLRDFFGENVEWRSNLSSNFLGAEQTALVEQETLKFLDLNNFCAIWVKMLKT